MPRHKMTSVSHEPLETTMRRFEWLRVLPVSLLLLAGCGNGDDDGASPDPEPPQPQRGELIGDGPTLVASYSTAELLAFIDNQLGRADS